MSHVQRRENILDLGSHFSFIKFCVQMTFLLLDVAGIMLLKQYIICVFFALQCGKSFKKRYTFKMHLLTHVQSLGDSK